MLVIFTVDTQTMITGKQRFFDKNQIIVSKTDLMGKITYVNDVFCEVSGYSEKESLGKPQSIVRHPQMPRCVFKLLWDTISSGQEIFAYVNNLAKNGDNYWVFAHVTPSFNNDGKIIGYHSSRRSPNPKAIETISPLYSALLAEEEKHKNRKDGMLAAYDMLNKILTSKGIGYDAFVFSL